MSAEEAVVNGAVEKVGFGKQIGEDRIREIERRDMIWGKTKMGFLRERIAKTLRERRL